MPVPACAKLAPACSCPPAPHEVGVCHRLCPLSFRDFVCLFGFARLLVSAPSRLQACSCPLYMKSVFVTGYALCLFPTSCDFSRPCPSAPCVIPHPHSEAPRAPTQIQCGGRFPRPPLYPTNGPNVTACRTRSPKLRCLPTPSDAVACSTGS